jgi:hypothetical protein
MIDGQPMLGVYKKQGHVSLLRFCEVLLGQDRGTIFAVLYQQRCRTCGRWEVRKC